MRNCSVCALASALAIQQASCFVPGPSTQLRQHSQQTQTLSVHSNNVSTLSKADLSSSTADRRAQRNRRSSSRHAELPRFRQSQAQDVHARRVQSLRAATIGNNEPPSNSEKGIKIIPNIPRISLRDGAERVDMIDEGFVLASLAVAEFRDWVDRCVEYNVKGIRYEFDTRLWGPSIAKWATRLLEADTQARLSFAKLYMRMLGTRRAVRNFWGIAVTSREVSRCLEEDMVEWEHIHFSDVSSDVLQNEAYAADAADWESAYETSIDPLHTTEIMDCALNARWKISYDAETGEQTVEYDAV